MRELTLEVTDRCMQNCLFCSTSAGPDCNMELPLNRCKEIMRSSYDNGCRLLNISGGEPLLYTHIWELLEYAIELRIKATIYTSGIVVDPDSNKVSPIDRDVFFKLKDMGHRSIKVYFDYPAGREKNYDRITGTYGRYPYLLKSIDNALLDYDRANIGLQFVVTNENYNDIDEVMLFCLQNKIQTIKFLAFVPQGRGEENKDSLLIPDKLLSSIREQLILYQKIYTDHIDVKIGTYLRKETEGITCSACKGYKLVVTPYGQYHTCEAFKNISIPEDIKIYRSIFEFEKDNNERRISAENKILDKYYHNNLSEGFCPVQAYIKDKLE